MASFYYIVLEHNTRKTEFMKNVIFKSLMIKWYKVSIFDVRKSMKCCFFIITYFCSDILKQFTKKGHILDLASFSCFRSHDYNFQLKVCVMLE